MTDFDTWFNRQGQEPSSEKEIPECLDGYEDPEAEGGYSFPCCRCGELWDIICEPEIFDPDNHYCGRSNRCIP